MQSGAHVGGADDEDAVVLAEPVHLAQQLQQALLALRRAAVAAAQPPRLADRVHLVCGLPTSAFKDDTAVYWLTDQLQLDSTQQLARKADLTGPQCDHTYSRLSWNM